MLKAVKTTLITLCLELASRKELVLDEHAPGMLEV
jgi:hypothetical protein